ncbi:peroxiredoxin [Anoxybacillus calidus]|jgi:cytochrome c biogenesis protein CcmG, thiol:disulfide interchange protein DsbE|uniref:Peroxiredoxin n=1 Tax=[Anoxybacillus] calidus TaxID=575178 RepID=A0A7V9YXS5_9BACL|nr:TlpA disulfide reductase family protein [Anoxybacillus calidus]MBA2870406.1 peroxiredoxin [Anoxybacillus calidus]
MKKLLATLLLLGLVGYGLWQVLAENNEKTTGLAIGNAAPDFELKTLDGKSIRLSELQGQKVILNFWATWCPPCRAEMPEMQNFYEKHNKDVEVFAVNLTSQDSRDKVHSFIKENGLTFPVVLDEEGDVLKLYKISPIPTSYIIDSEGIIRHKYVGPMTYDQMVELTESMK